jgi:hypothetical protein
MVLLFVVVVELLLTMMVRRGGNLQTTKLPQKRERLNLLT